MNYDFDSHGISKMADTNSVLCTWRIDPPRLRATFARQALPMTWDFAEACPLGDGAGNFGLCVQAIHEVLIKSRIAFTGTVQQADVTKSPLPDQSIHVWFTDPPYYDAIPYSDLSDFFLVWLKRASLRPGAFCDPFDKSNSLSPKLREAVQDETKKVDGQPKDRDFHKTTEGWEALLSGIIRGGWTITAFGQSQVN